MNMLASSLCPLFLLYPEALRGGGESQGGGGPEDVLAGHLTFKVEKKWIAANKIHMGSLLLNRYDTATQTWTSISTKRVREDRDFVYYTSPVPQFSLFAISGSQELPPPKFSVAKLTIEPGKATVGKPVSISAQVTNLTRARDVYSATLWLNDTVQEAKVVLLSAGETVFVGWVK